MGRKRKVGCTTGVNDVKDIPDILRKLSVNKKYYLYRTNTAINVTTGLMVLRDIGLEYDVPINIQFDGLYITVIVNFGKKDSRIHRFYLQDMYRYEEKSDDIYCCIKDDIREIVTNREIVAVKFKEE